MTTTVRARLNATIIGVENSRVCFLSGKSGSANASLLGGNWAHHRAKGFPVEAEVLELRAAWLRKGLRA